MTQVEALRRLALALPEVEDGCEPAEAPTRLVFSVRSKGLAWSFMERTAPKKSRMPRLDVLAVRCSLDAKEMLIEAAPERFFDDDHYRGYPAVLVRLEAIDDAEMAGLLESAWRLVAPKAVVKRLDAAALSPPPGPRGS